jgi:hypothetical protein
MSVVESHDRGVVHASLDILGQFVGVERFVEPGRIASVDVTRPLEYRMRQAVNSV